MKKYFYSVLAASMLFACSQEDIVDVTKGEGQKVTFKVEIPSTESRTVGGIEIGKGTQADNLIYAMYETGKDKVLISGVVTDTDNGEDDGTFTVTVPMAKDLKYDLLFFAYNAQNSAFEIASEAKDTDLKNLQFKANQKANVDAFDAFVGALKAQGISDPNDVTLKRPFAQINAATTAEDMENAKTLDLNVTQSDLVIKGVPASYNVLEATASGSVNVTYAASAIMKCDDATAYPENEQITVDGTNYYYLALAYVLAGEVTTTSTHEATFQFQRADGSSVSTLNIINLPIQRNYRTNVIGDLLTKSEEYTIKIDAEFDGQHVVGVWDGTSEEVEDTDNDNIYEITNAQQLAWVAEQVDNGETFKDKTVKLMNNIDLANVPWNPIGVSGDSKPFSGTFDGNGKTISNLYVDLTDEPLYESAGLFANASGATIKNFTIENAYVANRTVFGASSCGTAIVAGSGQGTTTIENVDVKDATIVADRYAGGIAGFYQGTIKDCDVDGIQITVKPNQNTEGTAYDNGDKVGGIIGYVNSSGTLTNNTVNDFTIRAYRDMGGIVGGNYAYVDGNKATNGTITVDQLTNFYEAKAANAGEIVGRQLGGTVGTNTHENVIIITLTEQNYVTSQESFEAALSAGGKIYLGKSTASRAVTADYVWKPASKSFEIIAVEDGVVIDMNCVDRQSLGAANIAASFEGVTLYYNGVEYSGFYHSTSETYTDCIIEGYLKSYAPVVKFTDCVFNQTKDNSYSLNMYGAGSMTITDCEFNGTGKGMFAYNEGPGEFNITITDTDFKANKTQSGKAAIQLHTEGGISGTLTLNNVTAEGFDSSINGGLYNELNNTTKVPTNKFVKIINGVTYIADGLSSTGNTYNVSNANGLVALSKMTIEAGKVVELTANINLEGIEFTGLNAFNPENNNTFDGKGYTISNWNYEGGASDMGFIKNWVGQIKDIKFYDCHLKTAGRSAVVAAKVYGDIDNVKVEKCSIDDSYWACGIIAGLYNGGSISNCTVTESSIKSNGGTGGIVGVINESGGERKVTNCSVSNSTINNTGDYGASYSGGGLIGMFNAENATYKIEDCTVSGNKLEGAHIFETYPEIASASIVEEPSAE